MKRITTTLLFCIISSLSYLSAQEHNSEVVEFNSHYVVKGNKLTENASHLIQINKRQGDESAHVALFYSKGDKLKIKTAQIEDMEGNIIRKLQNKDITDQNASSNSTMYSDDFVKHFKLVHNTYPYRIRYEYEYEQSRFFVIDALNCAYLDPLKKGTVIVETPTDYSLKYKQKHMDEPSIVRGEKGITYTWKFSYDTKTQPDINTNYNNIIAPQLTILPAKFKYGSEGGFDNWIEFGEWISNLNKGRDVLPSSEKQAIDRLVNGINNEYEKIKILYNYMQDRTRYIDITLGIGGLQSYPAEYVCINRYGDCKALTNYMQSMLKYIGVKSYYTLVNSAEFIKDIDQDFPSQAFNHVILTVPIEQDTLFLECTSKSYAFGYIPTSVQGRSALLVDNNNSHLIKIPQMQTEEIVNAREVVINAFESMNATVKIKTTLRGYPYQLYTYIKDNLNKNNVEHFISNNIMSGVYTLENYKFEDTDRNLPYIVMNTDLKMNSIYKKYGKNLSLSPLTWTLPNYETPENRKFELQINYPIHKIDKITYILPRDNFEKTPNNTSIESRFGSYYKTYKKEGENLVVEKKLIIKSGRYTLSEYADFYKFIIQVKNNELTNIFLEIL